VFGFLLKHWMGITWFLGWGVAMLALLDNYIDKRARRIADKSRSAAEKLAAEDAAGAQVIRTMALYRGGGPYSERDLRDILTRAGLSEDRVLPIMWKLEAEGAAERESVFMSSFGEVTWTVK